MSTLFASCFAFQEDVGAFVRTHQSDTPDGAEAVLKQLHELYGKYKFMEGKLVQQKKGILQKLPEIKSAIAALAYIGESEEKAISSRFELSDALYVKAEITKSNRVMLWLGANVMVEYTFAEAQELLSKNLANAEKTLETLNADLAFLKDQITVSEVNIARTHNHKVSLVQAAKAEPTSGKVGGK